MGKTIQAVLGSHSRRFDTNRFVYPVVSRRSRGLSIGVNVNPDKICNFDCPYCQVQREIQPLDLEVDFEVMAEELHALAAEAASGEIWNHERFAQTPQEYRRVNDVAFSGDGEPTTYRRLADAIELAETVKATHGLDAATILITNATRLAHPDVAPALAALAKVRHEIWAKLDAGTQERFELMSGTRLDLGRIVENIAHCAKTHKVLIQSLFPTIDGEGPSDTEVEAWCGRLSRIVESGGRIEEVQVYTTARRPADLRIGALATGRLEEIAVRARELGLKAEVFAGREWE
ncbi:MAG: hypothetical protein OEY28_06685 [Nitrospira sp.]|nr:hypothetical protein [Nitrospira sp.]